MSSDDAPSSFALSDAVRSLTLDGEISVELFDLALALSRSVLSPFPEVTEEPHDLATDFLLWLAKQRNLTVRSKSQFKGLIRRHWQRLNSPASHELWRILSAALKDLARQGSVRRIDASAESTNSNRAQWTVAPVENDDVRFDSLAFRERSKAIPFYPKSRKDGRSRRQDGKILSPEEARELTLSLLRAAGGPIEMGDLVAEAKRHVELPVMVAPPEPRHGETDEGADAIGEMGDFDDPGSCSGIHHSYTVQDEAQLLEDSRVFAELVWTRLQESEGAGDRDTRRLLCGYVIPKFLENSRVTMEDFGQAQRVKEQVDEVLARIGNLANVRDANTDPNQRWRTENLVMMALDILGRERCPAFLMESRDSPEKGDNNSFLKQ